jgi:thiol-disulfide isomerase/thioredoxin
MIERTLFTLILLSIGFAIYALITRRQIAKAAYAAAIDPLLSTAAPGVPTIVYFTTPTCAPCHLQQTPTLERLQQELGSAGLHVIRVDATQNPDAAERWGVFSVPTVFVLDKTGSPRSVHNGVVDAATLKRELTA